MRVQAAGFSFIFVAAFLFQGCGVSMGRRGSDFAPGFSEGGVRVVMEGPTPTAGNAERENALFVQQLKAKGIEADDTNGRVSVDISGSVFEFDNRLSSAGRWLIHNLAIFLNETDEKRGIRVEGQSPKPGVHLAAERARSVMEQLVREGVSRQRINLLGTRPSAGASQDGQSVQVILEN